MLAAEIVRFYYPELVDPRLLRPIQTLPEKSEQWKLLGVDIFERLGLTVPTHVMTQLAIAKPGIAQIFLYNLRMCLAVTGANTQLLPPGYLLDPRAMPPNAYPHMHHDPYQHMYNPLWYNQNLRKNTQIPQLPYIYPTLNEFENWQLQTDRTKATKQTKLTSPGSSPKVGSPSTKQFSNSNMKAMSKAATGLPNLAASLSQSKLELDEKNKRLQEKDDEIQELKAQMKRMEQLVQAKAAKIQELTQQIEKMNNTAN